MRTNFLDLRMHDRRALERFDVEQHDEGSVRSSKIKEILSVAMTTLHFTDVKRQHYSFQVHGIGVKTCHDSALSLRRRQWYAREDSTRPMRCIVAMPEPEKGEINVGQHPLGDVVADWPVA